MDYVRFGKTGLRVSRICLGGMTYADPAKGTHPWALGEEASRPFIKEAIELGITFFDTANSYSGGTAEEILGRALRDYARRDEVVIATKVFYTSGRKYPNSTGLSRKAIFREIDGSLRRLGTDYVDLYQIHRWDYETPIEETLEALHDVVKAGKARYIGASSMYSWQFAQALYVADLNGWTRFVSMQNYYNLLYREEEREMMPLLDDQGIGSIPWSPLARGRLARPWGETTKRSESDPFGQSLYSEQDRPIVDVVNAIAARRAVAPSQVALAWVLANPVVASPIIGATKPHHVDDAVAALSLTLDDDEIAALEAPYQPHRVQGFV